MHECLFFWRHKCQFFRGTSASFLIATDRFSSSGQHKGPLLLGLAVVSLFLEARVPLFLEARLPLFWRHECLFFWRHGCLFFEARVPLFWRHDCLFFWR